MGTELPNRRLRVPGSWLPPDVASALVECGHVDEARRQAVDGDWQCARALVRVLLAQDQVRTARDVLRPFADHGRWEAVESLASILDAHDRTDEAIRVP